MNIDCVKSYVAAEGRRKVRHSADVEHSAADTTRDHAHRPGVPAEGE